MLALWTLWATLFRVVHKSTGFALWFGEAIAAMSDHAELDPSVADGPAALVIFGKTDRLADESFVDVDRAAIPLDLAVVAHLPDAMIDAILGLAQHPIVAPR